METIQKHYRIDRKDISFLRFVIEAYDGIAVLTTVDREAGVVRFTISPGCEAVVEMVLQDLKKEMMIEELVWPLTNDKKTIHSHHRMSDECV